ncbi:MAG: FMN-binding negative transcriptional regulator [Candidatus Phosphoribacter sp.]|nr:FMN-binding negative transcriptional regulator [Actinomycetales bacterium]
MYVPAHFAMTDEQIHHILTTMGVAQLITHHPAEGLTATPVPFLFEPPSGPQGEPGEPGPSGEPGVPGGHGEHGSLLGHLARNNTQWSLPTTSEALVIIDAGDHYVSPSWLPSSADHGKTVPTWDYVTVHVHGELIAHDDPGWTRELVTRLTERHERALSPGWSVQDAAPGYIEAMVRAIVGIEVRITRVVGKAKMAQNKTPADVAALADIVAAQGDTPGERWLREVSLPAAQGRAALLTEVAARRRR